MDSSEFTPPARKSLTDQEISQKLGSATADESGMLAAMEFLEQQTRLRDEDNQATAAWLKQMQESTDPRAQLALENFERAKQGLAPISELPKQEFTSADESAEVFEEHVIEQAEPEAIPESIAEPVAEETVEDIERVTGFRLLSAANWILSVGVLAPAVAASYAALNGLNFVTSVLAGVVGVLVGVKVNVLGLVTARRTNRGLAVASRASFGVFGAILPGVLILFAGLGGVLTTGLGAGRFFNNTIVGLPDFESKLFTLGETGALTFGGLVGLIFILVASILAVFGGTFSRFAKVSLAGVVLIGFVTYAILSATSIDYLNLAGVFQPELFLPVAAVFALVVSVFTYGVDAEALSIASWGASRKRLAWPMLGFGVLLPVLVYGHQAALLNGHDFATPADLAATLLSTGSVTSASIMVDVAVVAVLGLLYWAIAKLIEALRTLGTNHIGYGSATLAAIVIVLVASATTIFSSDPLALVVSWTSLLLVPAATWIGVNLTETLMRRGKYHDASLTRAYGFYGAVNWISLPLYILTTVYVFGVSTASPELPWLGYLSSLSGFRIQNLAYSALLAMLIGVAFTLATGFPKVVRQQRETKAVEERRFDLLDVVVE